MKKIVALGMNALQRKQIHEFQAIADMGYAIDFFTNDVTNDSNNQVILISGIIQHYSLEKTILKRIIQISKYFFCEKNITFAHIYPGGRFAWIYLIYCKLRRIKTICIEWGNILDWDRLDIITKISLIMCYRYSNAIWYKEPYMEEKIRKLGGEKLFFIHNCYSGRTDENINQEKTHDFIWVNRLIPQRYVFWFINALKKDELKETKNFLLGLQENLETNNPINDIQRKLILQQTKNLQMLNFQDPFPYYNKSKFFILPSSIVFGNNSLIEAMSYGLIPIVTNTFGHELIVTDGYNGFVSENSEAAFIEKMIFAQSQPHDKLKIMSENAIKSIKDNFSLEQWIKKVEKLYENLEKL